MKSTKRKKNLQTHTYIANFEAFQVPSKLVPLTRFPVSHLVSQAVAKLVSYLVRYLARHFVIIAGYFISVCLLLSQSY